MSVADWLLLTVTVEAVSVTDEAPTGTVAAAETETAALLDETATLAPPFGADPESEMVQTVESPPARVAGAHTIEEGTGAWMVMDALMEVLLSVAVMVAVTLLGTGEVVAVNDPELLPAAMLTLPGTKAEGVLLYRRIVIPPDGAGPGNVMLHVLGAPPVTVDGPQPREAEGA